MLSGINFYQTFQILLLTGELKNYEEMLKKRDDVMMMRREIAQKSKIDHILNFIWYFSYSPFQRYEISANNQSLQPEP